MPYVAKTYKEDLTRMSLQNAAVSHSLPRKQKKKAGPKSGEVKLVVNTSDSGQRQVVSKPAVPPQTSHGSSSYPKKKNKKFGNQK